jgi:hypothetical protein
MTENQRQIALMALILFFCAVVGWLVIIEHPFISVVPGGLVLFGASLIKDIADYETHLGVNIMLRTTTGITLLGGVFTAAVLSFGFGAFLIVVGAILLSTFRNPATS